MKFFEDCAIGDTFESLEPYSVTAEEIKAFATQWDPQLYHLDEKEAEKLIGRLFAPGTLTLCIGTRLTHQSGYYDLSPAAGLGLDRMLMPKPVFAGDQLKVRVTLIGKRASSSKPGLGVLTSRHEVVNQDGDVVLSYILSALVYKRAVRAPD